MGILNVTPDSFSDGGRFNQRDAALRHVEQMVADGAALIDVGGESTRPGAVPVPVEQELERVVPMVEAIASQFDVVISVDTSSPEVMTASAAAGAGLINDVRALEREGLRRAPCVRGAKRVAQRCILGGARLLPAPSNRILLPLGQRTPRRGYGEMSEAASLRTASGAATKYQNFYLFMCLCEP